MHMYCVQDEDEDGQGTLTFGKKKEQASYGGMDEEEKAIWKVGIWVGRLACRDEGIGLDVYLSGETGAWRLNLETEAEYGSIVENKILLCHVRRVLSIALLMS